MSNWVTQEWTGGQTNALVKNLGEATARQIAAGKRFKLEFLSILTKVSTFVAPAAPAITTSKKYFEDAGVKRMGGNFQREFIELKLEAVPEAALAVHKLEEDSVDGPIMAERGDKAETAVQHFVAFLDAHREIPEWFIFYLKGKNGELWAVDARWDVDGDGWSVIANSVTDPDEWGAGDQVVSRN